MTFIEPTLFRRQEHELDNIPQELFNPSDRTGIEVINISKNSEVIPQDSIV
jgi:hypothetical protein